MSKIILSTLLIVLIISCTSETPEAISSEGSWKMGWRMIENFDNENYELAEIQFDSLLNLNERMNGRFLMKGLALKSKLSKKDEILKILSNQPSDVVKRFCRQDFSAEYKLCQNQPKEKVTNKELQLEVIKLFVEDQAIRENIMHDIIEEYKIDTTGLNFKQDISNNEIASIDEKNRKMLKSIFEQHGFPTKDLIGRDGMIGVFIIIQHADRDKKWQKEQLPKLKIAVDRGDLEKQNYAYLYDRIMVNEGKPQKFGTQFKNVDREKGIAELKETENIQDLNQRRREMEMMPIEMYKRLMLR